MKTFCDLKKDQDDGYGVLGMCNTSEIQIKNHLHTTHTRQTTEGNELKCKLIKLKNLSVIEKKLDYNPLKCNAKTKYM